MDAELTTIDVTHPLVLTILGVVLLLVAFGIWKLVTFLWALFA